MKKFQTKKIRLKFANKITKNNFNRYPLRKLLNSYFPRSISSSHLQWLGLWSTRLDRPSYLTPTSVMWFFSTHTNFKKKILILFYLILLCRMQWDIYIYIISLSKKAFKELNMFQIHVFLYSILGWGQTLPFLKKTILPVRDPLIIYLFNNFIPFYSRLTSLV